MLTCLKRRGVFLNKLERMWNKQHKTEDVTPSLLLLPALPSTEKVGLPNCSWVRPKGTWLSCAGIKQ
jgi:hypothetical protein